MPIKPKRSIQLVVGSNVRIPTTALDIAIPLIKFTIAYNGCTQDTSVEKVSDFQKQLQSFKLLVIWLPSLWIWLCVFVGCCGICRNQGGNSQESMLIIHFVEIGCHLFFMPLYCIHDVYVDSPVSTACSVQRRKVNIQAQCSPGTGVSLLFLSTFLSIPLNREHESQSVV